MTACRYRSSALVAFSATLLFVLRVNGFSVELIHRDSPKSPFYNHSLTHSDRLANAIRRSFSRVKHFSHGIDPNEPESNVTMNTGDYLMELSLGTPSFPIKAVADTGSDLIWTQCKPCSDCYEQADPLFDPKNSSTYKTIPCPSPQCATIGGRCDEDGSGNCKYSASDGDRSHSSGDYAVETLTLGSTTGKPVPFPKTLIGCGFENGGSFDKNGSGIIGLGGGARSLITQLSSSIDGKFSYCLVPYDSQNKTTSTLNFGTDAVVSGSGAVSTPIVPGQDPKTFYYLTLEGIRVGGDTKIPFPKSSPSASVNNGNNIVIDSGTTLTLLPQEMYSQLEDEVEKAIGLKRAYIPRIPLTLCYKTADDNDFKVPTLAVHFSDGDVKLEKMHTFIKAADGIVCLAFAAAGGIPIYGNLAQMNFLVGYDLKDHTVSFKPTDYKR